MGAQVADSRGLGELAASAENERAVYVATQWQLMRWRFRKHRMAVVALVLLAGLYVLAVFCEFFSPYDPIKFDNKLAFMPPQRIRFLDESGAFRRPFVYGVQQRIDDLTYQRTYVTVQEVKHDVVLFARGDPYKLWGLFPSETHLIGTVDNAGPLHLLGTDRMGRDMLSRIITGARISLSIGLVGVLMSLWQEEGLKVVELGRRAGLEPSTMTGLLDRMQRDKLLSRAADPGDRRVQRIYLTEEGRHIKPAVAKVVQRALDRTLEGVSEQDLAHLKGVLRQILINAKRLNDS